MTKCLTYSLNNFQGNKDSFYTELSRFTDSVLSKTDTEIIDFVNDFCTFIEKEKTETLRSKNEYIVELDFLGGEPLLVYEKVFEFIERVPNVFFTITSISDIKTYSFHH